MKQTQVEWQTNGAKGAPEYDGFRGQVQAQVFKLTDTGLWRYSVTRVSDAGTRSQVADGEAKTAAAARKAAERYM